MKRSLFLVALSTLLLGCETEPNREKSAKVEQQTNAYVQAFNAKNPQALAALWTEDAEYIDPATGTVIDGRKAIAEFFADIFKGNQSSQLTIHIDSISFPTPESAIEKGIAKVTYEDGEVSETTFKAVYVKKEDSWLISTASEWEKINPSSQFENLQSLNWLIGDWEDSDDNEDFSVVSEFSWDQYKNFLTEKFTTTILNHKEMDGRQIITWDANREYIRSWIFDSDGGFGEGKWKQKENQWFVEIAYTLADGRRASAINVYTKLNENTYQFESTGRMVEGELLPNVGPFEVIRKNNSKDRA